MRLHQNGETDAAATNGDVEEGAMTHHEEHHDERLADDELEPQTVSSAAALNALSSGAATDADNRVEFDPEAVASEDAPSRSEVLPPVEE